MLSPAVRMGLATLLCLGTEMAFRRTQEWLDRLLCIKTLRLNYRQYGVDQATHAEMKRLTESI